MKILRLAVAAAALAAVVRGERFRPRPRCASGLPRIRTSSIPTMARTYVGRIVFAVFCDKLFDIDEKLNIVPQLALSPRDLGRRQGSHHQAPARRQVPGRRAVRRGGREILARAAPDLAGLVPQAGACAAVDHVDVVDPLTIKLVLKSAVLAADRAAHRPRRHDGVAEGGEGGRRQVRPASGLRRSLQVRRARAAGPHRVREIRRLLEQGQRLSSTAIVFLPIVDATVRLANLKSGGLDLIERVLATDIKDVRADTQAQTVDRDRARLSGHHAQRRQRQGQGRRSASRAKVRQALDLSIDREAINQVVFNGEFMPGNQWVSPDHPYYQKAFPVRSATSPRPRRC